MSRTTPLRTLNWVEKVPVVPAEALRKVNRVEMDPSRRPLMREKTRAHCPAEQAWVEAPVLPATHGPQEPVTPLEATVQMAEALPRSDHAVLRVSVPWVT